MLPSGLEVAWVCWKLLPCKRWIQNNVIGADYTSQTPIDFDWYNPHPYQRTTKIIKKNYFTRFSAPHKIHTRTIHKCMKACNYNCTFPQTKNFTRTHLHYERDCLTNYVDIIHYAYTRDWKIRLPIMSTYYTRLKSSPLPIMST